MDGRREALTLAFALLVSVRHHGQRFEHTLQFQLKFDLLRAQLHDLFAKFLNLDPELHVVTLRLSQIDFRVLQRVRRRRQFLVLLLERFRQLHVTRSRRLNLGLHRLQILQLMFHPSMFPLELAVLLGELLNIFPRRLDGFLRVLFMFSQTRILLPQLGVRACLRLERLDLFSHLIHPSVGDGE